MSPFTTPIFIFLLFFTSFVTSAPRPFKKIYAFGDSYTDTGNTASGNGPNAFTYVSNLPYGSTFFHHPTNRYSDGRLVIDFVTESLSLPYLPPYHNTKADTSYGVNYAVAGSTAIPYSFFVKNNLTLDLQSQSLETQLAWFNKNLEGQKCKSMKVTPNECKKIFDDTLIWVGEIGANDYAYSTGSNVEPETIQQLSIRNVNGFLEALLNKGATYIVVEGLPTTGCLTLSMALAPGSDRDDMGCVGSLNKQSSNHNTILQTKIRDLRQKYPKSIIIYADYYNAYRSVIKNANRLGFKELYKVCCGSNGAPYNFDVLATCGSQSSSSCKDPSKYINWDGVHLTEAMNKALFESFIKDGFTHPPFGSLLSSKQNLG
ncbi:GDSL esterase/lipase At3g48460-like [Rutidosis leptorrhynchoides]|uniref:GDSL esterase/lipase At3g48460-like n=1 Tax=Rutidosis leptorrhynchoides TaxID=125765 RepID=UPI003A9965A5